MAKKSNVGDGSDEFADALAESPDAFAEIFDAANNEVLRRLKDPVAAAELPGTTLLQIALVGAKERDKAAEAERNKAKEIVRGSAVDVILESTSSPKRKLEMLEVERARLEGEYLKVQNLIAELSS